MNTTTADAALQAHVTVATIRTWCRRGVIAATKRAGRWAIDTASLARRITIGTLKRKAATMDVAALRAELDAINQRLTPARNASPDDRERGLRDRVSGTLKARHFARTGIQVLDLAEQAPTDEYSRELLKLLLFHGGYVSREPGHDYTPAAHERAEKLLALARNAESRIKK